MRSLEIRVRGQLQGVGFRPVVWRLARELGLDGSVASDAQGVLIRAAGPAPALAAFLDRLEKEPPPLARVEAVEAVPFAGALATGFQVLEAPFAWRTLLEPDTAPCVDCAREVLDPFSRRYRYPFTSCARCGPAFGLLLGPGRTSVAAFDRCLACAAEVADASGRHFQAAATACHRCGPRARLVRLDGRAVSFEQHSMLDDVDAAASLLKKGEVLALKGPGGYQLLADATRAEVVQRLRAALGRGERPFALLARDLEVVRRHAVASAVEAATLAGPQAPVVVLRAAGLPLPAAVAPGLSTLGVQLPPTALHLLLLRGVDRPLVLASGNRAGEAPALGDAEARRRLAGLASHALVHDREVAGRADEAVVQVVEGRARTLRRGRGQAPSPLPLPPGLAATPALLALGSERDAAFCLVRDGQAFLSPHLGDLAGPDPLRALEQALEHHAALLEVSPAVLVGGTSPAARRSGQGWAAARGVPWLEVLHAHAHLAACLAESGRPAAAARCWG